MLCFIPTILIQYTVPLCLGEIQNLLKKGMIIVRKISHRTVFSSSWTRREQAEKLDEWQNQARKATNCGQSTRHRIGLVEKPWSTQKQDIWPTVAANNDKNRHLWPHGGIGRRSGLTQAQWLVGEQHSFLRPKSAFSIGVRVRVPVGLPYELVTELAQVLGSNPRFCGFNSHQAHQKIYNSSANYNNLSSMLLLI